MNYWLGLFSVETYEEFQKAGSQIVGFRANRLKAAEKIETGDQILCYLTGISRWAGILSVSEKVFQSEDKIWEVDLFPVRLRVKPEILLRPEYAVPHKSLIPNLPSSATKLSALLRSSPNLIPKSDAELIVEAISRAEESPVRRTYDKKKMKSNFQYKSNEGSEESSKKESRLCPWFPQYSKVRGFLKSVEGIPQGAVATLESTLMKLRGTPQDPVSWDDPDQWIANRLEGESQAVAQQIWEKSGKRTNPRYLLHSLIVANKHDLLETDSTGNLKITESGHEFLDLELSPTERGIDLQEGIAHLLRQVMSRPKSRRGDLLDEWREYVHEVSNYQKEASVKDLLSRRLNNLLDRNLLKREGQFYQITDNGKTYYQTLTANIPESEAERAQIIVSQVEEFNQEQRKLIQERLDKMAPYAFEYLIHNLLVEMGYEDVEVTQPSNDKGVDVKAVAQFGITSINEVIQAKRQKGNIQRTILDMLRGSLHRFKAQKGTIITTGDFGKGARAAAFEMGAAPITLINGETLIDLLIEHQIVVKRKTIEYIEIDEDAFTAGEDPLVDIEDELIETESCYSE